MFPPSLSLMLKWVVCPWQERKWEQVLWMKRSIWFGLCMQQGGMCILGMFLLSQFRNMDLLRYISYFKSPGRQMITYFPLWYESAPRCDTDELFGFRMEHLKRKKRKYVIISKACGRSDRNDLTANLQPAAVWNTTWAGQIHREMPLNIPHVIEIKEASLNYLHIKCPQNDLNRFVMSYNSRSCWHKQHLREINITEVNSRERCCMSFNILKRSSSKLTHIKVIVHFIYLQISLWITTYQYNMIIISTFIVQSHLLPALSLACEECHCQMMTVTLYTAVLRH